MIQTFFFEKSVVIRSTGLAGVDLFFLFLSLGLLEYLSINIDLAENLDFLLILKR